MYKFCSGALNTSTGHQSLRAAHARAKHLKALEADVDLQLEYARRNLKYIKQDEVNKSYAYVTRDDLISIYGQNVVLVIPNHDDEVKIEPSHVRIHIFIRTFIRSKNMYIYFIAELVIRIAG